MKTDTERHPKISVKDALIKVRELLKIIRDDTPKMVFDTKKAASSDIRIGYLKNKPVKRLVVTLRSSGCGWIKESFGCTMCGHYAGTTKGEKIDGSDYIAQFVNEIKKYDLSDTPLLCLYNAGSILNGDEISTRALGEILKEISKRDEIKKVVFETRSEYVNEESIRNIKQNLRQDDVEIALGLESTDEKVRSLCLNKGLDRDDFFRAVKLIKENFGLRLYLMIKPLFLTEREGVEDAVRSFNDTLAYSPDEIHFEPATIQDHTIAHHLHKSGEYRPPWLWSIIEVLKRLPAGQRVYVSPFQHTPSPTVVPYNCKECTPKITKMILEDYNTHFDPAIFDGLECGCKEDYQRELSVINPRPLEERVYHASSSLLDKLGLSC